MQQNSRVTAFTVFELLRENQRTGGGIKPPPPRLGLNQLLLWVNELFSIYFQKCDNNSF